MSGEVVEVKRGKRGRGQGRYENLEDLAEVWHRLPRSAPHTGRPGVGRRSAGTGAGFVRVNAGVDGVRRAVLAALGDEGEAE